jgi:hypothetical protein
MIINIITLEACNSKDSIDLTSLTKVTSKHIGTLLIPGYQIILFTNR